MAYPGLYGRSTAKFQRIYGGILSEVRVPMETALRITRQSSQSGSATIDLSCYERSRVESNEEG